MTDPKTVRKAMLCAQGGLALAVVVFCWRHLSAARGNAASPPKAGWRGELIADAGNSAPSSPALSEDETRRRHPKPPSVQRRMVLAQLTLAQTGTSNPPSMAAGTAGTAADWAKGNGRATTNIETRDIHLPGYLPVSFSTLAGFDCVLTGVAPGASSISSQTAALLQTPIPQNVQSLDGKKAVIEGFLLPVKMNNGLAVEFLLMRNQSMCCYGVPPKINEWITVQTDGPGVQPVTDQPILVAGTLHVGKILENGELAGLFRMDADKIIGP